LRSGNWQPALAGKKAPRLSHPSHGVLEAFEFTFEIKIFYLMSIQMRIEKFRGINLSATPVTHHSIISDITKLNARMI
jgi:hypothetical protein